MELNITEGTIILVAQVLKLERKVEELPMSDAIELIKKALKSLT